MVHNMEGSGTPGQSKAGELLDSDEDFGVPVCPTRGLVGATDTGGAAGWVASVAIDNSLSRLFVAAYLLTGCAKQAEAAVSESIRRLGTDATRAGRLSWKAIDAALMREGRAADQTADEAAAALPLELARVLRLSPLLRRCFVLRVLMAMPRQYCAGLLRIDAEQVDANSSLAAQELARSVAGETAN